MIKNFKPLRIVKNLEESDYFTRESGESDDNMLGFENGKTSHFTEVVEQIEDGLGWVTPEYAIRTYEQQFGEMSIDDKKLLLSLLMRKRLLFREKFIDPTKRGEQIYKIEPYLNL